jgi:hypothetical protein
MLHPRVSFLAAVSVALAACGGAAAAPRASEAPHLDIVEPMASVLHIQWTEVTPCDTIEAERKDDQDTSYAVAFDVTGDKTSHMDGDAFMNMTYTYRLRCQVGSTFSGYSNELSANPTVKGP